MSLIKFEKYKPLTIELSSLNGVEGLAIDYDIMEDYQYEHSSKISLDDESNLYELHYLTNEAVLVEYDKALYHFKIAVENEIDEMEDTVNMLQMSSIEIDTNMEHSVTYTPVFGKKMKIGSEQMVDSIEPDMIDKKFDVLLNLYQRAITDDVVEYLLALIVEGNLYMYIGVEIPESSIL